ncbi:hypothetical protein RVR34_19185 [Microcystis aeruginosa FBCC-A68]|nr:hypothetical protein [Microcystis aeruginosa]
MIRSHRGILATLIIGKWGVGSGVRGDREIGEFQLIPQNPKTPTLNS